MVFQQFNLFPHLSVLRNITLALRKLKKLSEDEAVALLESGEVRVESAGIACQVAVAPRSTE